MKQSKTEISYNCSQVRSEFFPSNYWDFSKYSIFCFNRKSFSYSKIFNFHYFAPLMISDKVTLFNIPRKLPNLHILDDSETISKIVNKAAFFGMLLLEAS